MDTARLTNERLRNALNSDQVARERMCLAILALDRNYSDIRPRRPEGGRDGSRDIQCLRDSQICFGAVGFMNNVSDSPIDKRGIKKKFKDDLNAALKAETKLRSFVFFTNVDLTPSELEELSTWGKAQGISFVDIYWRERILQSLNSAEGLAIRYQYLEIPLSNAEQASFFSRFGSDLQRLVTGRFDSIEQKIDNLEFINWKNGTLREIFLELELRDWEESRREAPEHFRVFVELQSVMHEKRSIMIGGRDDFRRASGEGWYFGTKTFFWREQVPQTGSVWIPQNGLIGGGIITALRFGAKWFPRSPVLITEFEDLKFQLYVTENLIDRLAWVRLRLDSYVLVDREIKTGNWESYKLSCWPEELTPDEAKIQWRFKDVYGWLNFDRTPPRVE